MPPPRYTIGLLGTHPNKPDWGPGKVLDVSGGIVVVYFRDLPEAKAGDAVKRIDVKTMPLLVASVQSDPWLDALPPLKGGKLSHVEPRVTPAQSIDRFLQHFPKGFADPKYLSNERGYKWNAHQKFVDALGDGKGAALLANGRLKEAVTQILSAERAVNLLSLYEKSAFADGLKNDAAASDYADALFRLIAAPNRDQAAFERLIAAVANLPAEEGRARVATWPVLTMLPFLAQPQRFMFLKPEVTQKAAERLLWNLNYTSKLNWLTYSRLLDMSDELLTLLQPLGARDLIDVQSFIWVTGFYGPAKA